MVWSHLENRYDDDHVSSACGLFGVIDTSGTLHDGSAAIEATSMDERERAGCRVRCLWLLSRLPRLRVASCVGRSWIGKRCRLPGQTYNHRAR